MRNYVQGGSPGVAPALEKICLVTDAMMMVLEVFNHRIAIHIAEMTEK